ncbi:MAG: hypothetical protein E7404_06215 [Ruminococcaceae bacterium]|nr:hypothetical protein [Oscillospiraceae bacterium]
MSHVGIAAVFQDSFDDNSDDYEVSKAVDFYGTSFPLASAFHSEEQIKFMSPMLCDYLRGIDKNYFVHEVYSDWGSWYEPEKPERLRYMLWSIISHGAKGLLYWQMRAERLGLENNLAGFLNMDGSNKQITKVVSEVGKILADNKKIFSNAEPEKADIVFVYDYSSLMMSNIEDHDRELFAIRKCKNPVNYYNKAVYGMYKLLIEEGYRIDFIDSRDIEKINDYKVAYFPYAAMLDNNSQKTLKSFADNGGILLLDEGFGLRQKNTWLATNHIDFDVLFDARWNSRVRDYKDKNETFVLDGEKVTIKPYKTEYEVKNAKVIATFDDNVPAILKVASGKGQIILFGSSIGYSYALFGEKGWKSFIKNVLCEIPAMDNYGDGIITTINKTPDGELKYIFNTNEYDINISCEFDKIVFGGKTNDKKLLVNAGDVACVFIKK